MATIVRFDCYEVDLAAGQLLKRGARIRLREQCFQVLAALVARPGQVVTREELRQRLWPDHVFVDFDNNLNTAIARLREVLNDSAEHPRFIETLPRHGYRFVGTISEPAVTPASAPKRTRLLVLPFVNSSGDAAQEYNSDAVTDEIISELAGLRSDKLAVLARTTSIQLKRTRRDIARIGRELEVDYLVDGTVRQNEDRVTITVRLIRMSDQTHVLARTYQVEPGTVTSLKEDIARAIAAEWAARPLGIAVLPFRNVVHREEDDYFADGITDGVITSLARIRSLRVISRSSVHQYRDQALPARDIGREMKVDYLVEGSMWHLGNRVRVSVHLVHASSDSQLWAETYDLEVGDIFTVLGEITRAIASAIGALVSPDERARLSGKAINREAHEAYLRGQFLISKQTTEAVLEAHDWFRKAIDCDHTHAMAHAGLSRFYSTAATLRLMEASQAIGQAKAAARAALAADPELATAHSMYAFASSLAWEIDDAEREFREAIRLDPSDAATRRYYAHLLSWTGRNEEAIQQVALAEEVDPLSPTPFVAAALVHYAARDFTEAIAKAGKAIDVSGSALPLALYVRGLALVKVQQFDAAVGDMVRALEASHRHAVLLAGLGYVRAFVGQGDEARNIISELITRGKSGGVTSLELAEVYAGLGDHEEALRHLEIAFDEHVPQLLGAYCDPIFESLRDDRRFRALASRVGVLRGPS